MRGRGHCHHRHIRKPVDGELIANDTVLTGGGALKLTDVTALTLRAGRNAEVLVFDLPGERH